MSTSKLGKNQWAEMSPQKKNPFELPRLITRQIKECTEAHASGGVAPVENIKYLWIHFGSDNLNETGENLLARRSLTAEQWKNVIDEAASLGVRSIVVSVAETLTRSEELWDVCRWAQNPHEMSVALYVKDTFNMALLQDLSKLDLSRTCVLAPQERFNEAQSLIDAGVKVCVANVNREERPIPCNGPRSMIYVAAEGKLYPCALMHGEQHALGDVLEDPLAPIRRNDSLAWSVTAAECPQNCCDACPSIMEKRMFGLST